MLTCINQMLGQRKRRASELPHSDYTGCIILKAVKRKEESGGEENREQEHST